MDIYQSSLQHNDEVNIHRTGTIIEGLGDELVYTVATVAFIIMPGTWYFLWRLGQRATNQQIHPESEAIVDQTRLRLPRLQEQNTNTPVAGGQQSNNHARTSHRNNGELSCPVCLAEAEYAVETNCGHIFCGRCMIAYWRHGNWLGAVRCPVCRQYVTILLLSFTEAESRGDSEQKEEVINDVHNYNRRFSGEPRPIMDYIYDLPTLLRHAFSEFFSLNGLLWMFRFRIIVCLFVAILYFISPFDIIPEAAFGLLGLMDDVLIVLLLAIYVSIMYRQFVEYRAQQT